MNLRCTYCQTPFTVGRLEKLAAIQRMQAENMHHYDVFCPHCRRANSVSRQRLEIFTPGWQEGLRTLEAEAAKVERERVETVPAPAETKPALADAARNRHTHRPVTAAPARAVSTPKPAAKAKAAPAKAAPKKAVAKAAPSPKGKPAAKKPAKKSAPVAKKTAAKSASSPKGKSTAKVKKVVKKK